MKSQKSQILSYRPCGKRLREAIATAETREDAQVIALVLLMQVEGHRDEFRKLGYWPPHMRELTELYPFARQVLRSLSGHASPEQTALDFRPEE